MYIFLWKVLTEIKNQSPNKGQTPKITEDPVKKNGARRAADSSMAPSIF
jgi:hypothetical protein